MPKTKTTPAVEAAPIQQEAPKPPYRHSGRRREHQSVPMLGRCYPAQWRRSSITQRTVRTHGIVMLPPQLDDHLRFFE